MLPHFECVSQQCGTVPFTSCGKTMPQSGVCKAEHGLFNGCSLRMEQHTWVSMEENVMQLPPLGIEDGSIKHRMSILLELLDIIRDHALQRP